MFGNNRHKIEIITLLVWPNTSVQEKTMGHSTLHRHLIFSFVCKHQIQSEYGDEQTDAGRDCRNCLARPNS